jgi:hypothetical protein
MRQCWNRLGPQDITYYVGERKLPGDSPSRSCVGGIPRDANDGFLQEFSKRHPLPPQLGWWRLVHPTAEIAPPSSNAYWQRWYWFAHDVGRHPLLIRLQGTDPHLERSNLFLAFACAMRNGEYHNGLRPSASQITEMLRWCAHCMVANGLADPKRATPGQHNLVRAFSSCYEKCKRVDPPPEPQQALPNSTVQ